MTSPLKCGIPDCDDEDTILYPCGRRCAWHRPGPQPRTTYCAPNRCYHVDADVCPTPADAA